MLAKGNLLTETVLELDQIPDAIRKARELRGLTVSETARLSGISLRQYQRIEHGCIPKISTLEKICNALGLILTVYFGLKNSFPQKD